MAFRFYLLRLVGNVNTTQFSCELLNLVMTSIACSRYVDIGRKIYLGESCFKKSYSCLFPPPRDLSSIAETLTRRKRFYDFIHEKYVLDEQSIRHRAIQSDI